MALVRSTGLTNGMLGTVGFNGAMTAMLINIYTGTQPASPNSAPTGTLLCTISLNGTANNGMVFGAPSAGVISMPSGASWSGTNVATGNPGSFVAYNVGDTLGSSTTANRFSGTCGIAGSGSGGANPDLVVTASTLTSGVATPITSMTITPQ